MRHSAILVLLLLAGCAAPWFGHSNAPASGSDSSQLGAIVASRPAEPRATEVTDPYDAEGYEEEDDPATSAENQRLLAQLKAKGVDVRASSRGVVINLPDVLFEFGKSALTPRASGTIGEIAAILRDAESRQMSIEGQTDSVGTIETNYRLSEARAQAVARELEKNQIPARRLATKALGETDPISTNRTAEGRTMNRRVEIVVLNPR